MKKWILVAALSLPLWARPIVIAHRGASGYLPEHTLAAYALAVQQGADYIEPDLVPTRDGVLIARHENDLSETTDVSAHPEFAARKTTKVIDGHRVTGWFSEDFSLAEIRTLHARGRNRASRTHNDEFTVATFDEVLAALRKWEVQYGRTIGVYPETKHPSYFRGLGLGVEEPMLECLARHGFRGPDAAVYIQSFEVSNLRRLKGMTEFPLVQLVDDAGAPQDWVEAGRKSTYADMLTDEGLKEVAEYATVLAPYKGLLIRHRKDWSLGENTGLIERAHRAGLQVHSWTFRAENEYLPAVWRSSADPQGEGHLEREARTFFEAGLDGMFSNHPDRAVQGLP